MERYILKYLCDNASDVDVRRAYDYLKSEIDFRLWSQGRHSANSWDFYRASILSSLRQPKWKKNIKAILRFIKGSYRCKSDNNVAKEKLVLPSKGYNVLSVVNLPQESHEALDKCGVNYVYVDISKSAVNYDLPALEALLTYQKVLQQQTFSQLISKETIKQVLKLYEDLRVELSNYSFDAVLVRTSELFVEKILIDIFRSFNKPSITLLHGLPGIYTKATESRADYLLVWGDKIRDAFISTGYNPKNVMVAGNYKYSQIAHISDLRCSLDDVLILTTETWADGQHEWEYDKFSTHDRSLLITYLYSVENVLKQNGVTHARLRPHPHVNKEWISEYIDSNFYTLDRDDLMSSLRRATMCIGPTSSTMIESLMSGVSYLTYEPGDGIHNAMGSKLETPFNTEYKYLKVAYNEDQLSELIQSHYKPEANKILQDFLQSFNPQVIKNILDKHSDK
jgi:hypothetical protein